MTLTKEQEKEVERRVAEQIELKEAQDSEKLKEAVKQALVEEQAEKAAKLAAKNAKSEAIKTLERQLHNCMIDFTITQIFGVMGIVIGFLVCLVSFTIGACIFIISFCVSISSIVLEFDAKQAMELRIQLEAKKQVASPNACKGCGCELQENWLNCTMCGRKKD